MIATLHLHPAAGNQGLLVMVLHDSKNLHGHAFALQMRPLGKS